MTGHSMNSQTVIFLSFQITQVCISWLVLKVICKWGLTVKHSKPETLKNSAAKPENIRFYILCVWKINKAVIEEQLLQALLVIEKITTHVLLIEHQSQVTYFIWTRLLCALKVRNGSQFLPGESFRR